MSLKWQFKASLLQPHESEKKAVIRQRPGLMDDSVDSDLLPHPVAPHNSYWS